MSTVPFARLRRLALVSSSLVALGAGSGVAAQSYNAPDPTVTAGSVTFNRAGPNEVYTVGSPTAILDFVPTDRAGGTTPINFQNGNSSVLYTGPSNFTVLNRIVPVAGGRAVQFNGTVRSQVAGSTGGSVWFYSPGGIIAAPTSVFDVGNLLLTAADPANGGTTITPASFTGGGTGEAGVEVYAGAQLNAIAEGSYIALVAPRVIVDGDIRVNGQAALVAGEQATITINAGLLDISLGTGSDAAGGSPLQIRGSITGPASTGSSDPHGIYAVALPKNSAISMLVGGNGNIGFDVATNASINNGVVKLYSGYSRVTNSTGSTQQGFLPADVVITGGRYTSNVEMNGTRNGFAAATNATPQFDRSLYVNAPNAHVGARQSGVTLNVVGDLIVNGAVSSTFTNNSTIYTGGTTRVYTENGGILNVGGNLTMFSDVNITRAGNTTPLVLNGGDASMFTSGGGAIRVAGTTNISANAIDNSLNNPAVGTRATAGSATVYANGGNITLTGAATIAAYATSLASSSITANDVGLARGGNIFIQTGAAANPGQITFGGPASLLAYAVGDRALTTGGYNGNAIGGSANVQVRDSAFTSGLLSINASGYAGNTTLVPGRPAELLGSIAGSGTGGTARLELNGGATTIAGINLLAGGSGGLNRGGGDGIGGAGTGGAAQIVANGGTNLVAGAVTLVADGIGGGKNAGTTGGGGTGSGGNALVRANGGALTINGGVTAQANGVGGTSIGTGVAGNGGAGNGGGARLDVLAGGGSITVNGAASLDANGTGGNATVTAGSVGGAGTAGTDTAAGGYVRGAYVVSQAGAIALNGRLDVRANGFGGSGATGGSGTGGLSNVVAQLGTITAGQTFIEATGNGGNAVSSGQVGGGGGGNGVAGEVYAVAEGVASGQTRLQLGATEIRAWSFGGDGAAGVGTASGGNGGTARGGFVNFLSRASSLGVSSSSLNVSVYAEGGDGGASSGGTGGIGGAGNAGTMTVGSTSGNDFAFHDGRVAFGNTSLDARGLGGRGGNGAIGGTGGAGVGGEASLLVRGTDATLGSLSMQAFGQGGNGGTGTTAGAGGVGIGGGAGILVSNRYLRTERGRLSAGAVQVTTSGFNGSGAAGATAQAGSGLFQSTSGDVALGSFSYGNSGGLAASGITEPLTVDVSDGLFAVAGPFVLNSTGNAVIGAHDNGVLSAGSINAVIRGDVFAYAEGITPGIPGVIAATGLSNWNVTGDLTLDSNVVGGNVFMFARNIDVADITAQTNVNLGINAIGQLSDTVSTGAITALDNISLNAADTVTSGPLFAGDTLYAYAQHGITINGAAIAGARAAQTQGQLPSDGGLYLFTDQGPISAGDLTGQMVVVSGESFADDLPAPDPAVSVQVGNVIAKAIDISSTGTLTTGNLTVTDQLYPRFALRSDESPLLFAGAIGAVSTGNVSGGYFGLIASRDAGVSTGDIAFTGSVAVLAGQNANLGQATTGRGSNDLLYVANASVLSDPLLSDYFESLIDQDVDDPDVPFSPALLLQVNPAPLGGALTIAGANTGNLIASAQSVRIGATDASQRIQLIATGLLDVTGAMIAPRIDFRSGDLDLAAQARVGNANTTALNLVSTGQTTTVGGDGGATGYRLTNAEAGRLSAQRTTITGGQGVTVRELALTGSSTAQNSNLNGGAAAFEVRSGGVLRVEGAVTMAGAQSTDRLNLVGSTRIEVATDAGGSIALRSASSSGGPGGILSFAAPVIAVAPDSTLTRLAQDPRFAGRDAILAAAASQPRPEGYITANTIAFAANNLIAVQNSGSPTTAAGFTVGAGGMSITNTGNGQTQTSTPLEVRIFGRQQRDDGTFVTNAQALAAVTRSSDPNVLDSGSGLNNCLFTAVTCGGSLGGSQTTDDISVSPVVQALVEAAANGDPVEAASVPAIRIVRLLDETAINLDPVSADPVTGGGNAGLWDTDDSESDDDDGGDAAPADKKPEDR